uniref:Uncharacterized protein n=1 Tax=Angiostrongylus cantonensis TaxID=6313 RepID=A0A0K0DCU6_ANGCA
MLTSASAASLAALSNRSVHGSDGEADPNDHASLVLHHFLLKVESTVSSRVVADDSIFTVGSGSTTPPLNKLQNDVPGVSLHSEALHYLLFSEFLLTKARFSNYSYGWATVVNAHIYQDRLSINIGTGQIDDIQDEVKILKKQPELHVKFEDLCR